MTVLVDTSVWSLALRRKRRDLSTRETAIVHHLRDLMIADEVALIPLIRQEVLSGIASKTAFGVIQSRLAAVPVLLTPTQLFDVAAEFYNACRAHGVAAEAIDMTICAAAHSHGTPVFTTDPDFSRYVRHL